MDTILKKYSGEISVSISEFSNMQVLDSLSIRQLNPEEVVYLLQIADTYKPKEVRYSEVSDMDEFIRQVVQEGKTGILDQTIQVDKTILIDGDSKIIFENENFITFGPTVVNGFYLKKGTHEFIRYKTKHLNNSGSSHVFTDQTPSILWKNFFDGCIMEGGSYGYNSSRGGTPTQMSTTFIANAKIDVEACCISVFSQDGPYKNLHLENVVLKSKTSHNIYVHPSVSLHYVNVKTLGAGKLMQHQYSGSGNGGYNTGLYSYFEKVDVTLPNTGTPYDTYAAFEMTTLANDNPVIIKDSKIGPYVTSGVKPAIVDAVNTQFVNAGNGIFLRGKITNCTGGVWPSVSNAVTIENCNLSEISYRGGGTLIANNSTISNIWGADRGASFEMTFRSCKIGTIYDGGSGDGKILLINTPMPNLTPSTFRKDMIVLG